MCRQSCEPNDGNAGNEFHAGKVETRALSLPLEIIK
jgi:hypothetical protein